MVMSKAPGTPSLWLDFPLRKIQFVRLAQALMESNYDVHLSEDTHGQFEYLSQFFPLQYSIGRGEAPLLPQIEFDHSVPLTKIGTLERPLIFPRASFDRCRAAWPETRPVRFFFAGRVTRERARALRSWADISEIEIQVPRPIGTFSKWFRRRFLRSVPPAIKKTGSDEISFWSSMRGREYPVKAWDEDYYQAMARAQFVLCPSGDFVWTYRFFEAAMCGAIPVVEAACPAYEGFRFFTMQQPIAELRWTEETAEHNFRLCCDRLTISRQQLDAEIARLLRA
jgi:hypothetical protein